MTTPDTGHPVRQGFAFGITFGAAILLLTVGVLSILQGISAVAEDNIFVVGLEYTYKFDTTAWGWIHIVLGILLAICAVGLMLGSAWGRAGAVIFAALSIIANFLWLPYYPAWSILVIVLDVVVIWAVSTWHPKTI